MDSLVSEFLQQTRESRDYVNSFSDSPNIYLPPLEPAKNYLPNVEPLKDCNIPVSRRSESHYIQTSKGKFYFYWRGFRTIVFNNPNEFKS